LCHRNSVGFGANRKTIQIGKFNATGRGDQQLLMDEKCCRWEKETGTLEFECPGKMQMLIA
jgi:hypothetical protein